LHAFVLMDNHVHLLVDGPSARGVSMAMRRLGQCYVQSFNLKHRARKRGSKKEGQVHFRGLESEPDPVILPRHEVRDVVEAKDHTNRFGLQFHR
ncbi:hypothetical protein ACFWZ3_17205, partial [Frateuria sp. GZRR35]